MLDAGADPSQKNVFGRTPAERLINLDQIPLEDRLSAIDLMISYWSSNDSHKQVLIHKANELRDQLVEKSKKKDEFLKRLQNLLTTESLKDPEWSQNVIAFLPQKPLGTELDENYDEDFEEDENDPEEVAAEHRSQLKKVCKHLLSDPKAISHPSWGEVVRFIINLCPSYAELTENAYGEALDPTEDAAEDEGGVIEMIEDFELSTIPDAFELLSSPEAIKRSDWEKLVELTINTKAERMGTGCFLSNGWEEADEMFNKDYVCSHPKSGMLWDQADQVFPLKSDRP